MHPRLKSLGRFGRRRRRGRGGWVGHEGRFSRYPLQVYSVGSYRVQFWHGQGRPLFDVALPALPLPTTASPTFLGTQKDGPGEADARQKTEMVRQHIKFVSPVRVHRSQCNGQTNKDNPSIVLTARIWMWSGRWKREKKPNLLPGCCLAARETKCADSWPSCTALCACSEAWVCKVPDVPQFPSSPASRQRFQSEWEER